MKVFGFIMRLFFKDYDPYEYEFIDRPLPEKPKKRWRRNPSVIYE